MRKKIEHEWDTLGAHASQTARQARPTTVAPKVKKQQIVFDLDSKENVTAKSTDGQSSEYFTIQIEINSSGSR